MIDLIMYWYEHKTMFMKRVVNNKRGYIDVAYLVGMHLKKRK